MQVFIRTDASIQIGTGHVMRCLTLAKQLKSRNVVVTFICRNLEGNLINFITEQGFDVLCLSEIPKTKESPEISHWDWTRDNWFDDAEETILLLKKVNLPIELLVVDHYSIDINWEQKLQSIVKKIMVIDDIADRKHDCDLLLDQNFYCSMENRYSNLVPEKCYQFLGPSYALLREEFLNINPSKIIRDGTINNILIFFGGTDSAGATLKILYAIKELIKVNIIINVVIGFENPFKEQIESFCNKYENVILHCNIDYMANLMSQADLAIGAGGTASWERIYLRLPSVVVTTASNQLELTRDLAHTGAIKSLGVIQSILKSDIQSQLKLLIDNPQAILKMVESCNYIINYSTVKKNRVSSRILEIINDTR
ncbi:UDP-2,4-diacetamido-2,4,6-trideoxy-beta-L-altropyranose hydrolase [Psychrobacillus sp. Sa2BUA9]|uniref:UDP-2,4-diacetamido-2,4, 6-trideoxy-beta-L-altropyranose hydrolase n=1 Tax=Psychrobacillus faecigallinarum TaxID=2762235 RepID=A0ABR8R5P3_9BACI|nr:UDP-2,4-diacetamido-2,4,6-trideoxy-beta-L-altropyranose hydrolase [Psychrobacillus faecigallinarum]MBD7943034.1 UDP-2,4-diacetamido-2,4,6-trideoxy-beta-L-altropyranose hydrolase [Psychrobacillus faecigallinarum]